jgi:hypothetical protein
MRKPNVMLFITGNRFFYSRYKLDDELRTFIIAIDHIPQLRLRSNYYIEMAVFPIPLKLTEITTLEQFRRYRKNELILNSVIEI